MWLNKDVATIIRNYVDDPMTYGRLLCTSKLFGYNEDSQNKIRMINCAIKQLDYELSPIRPKTAYSQYASCMWEIERTYDNYYRSNEFETRVSEQWKMLTVEERDKYHIYSENERRRYNKAVANLKIPGYEDKLHIRRNSARLQYISLQHQ